MQSMTDEARLTQKLTQEATWMHESNVIKPVLVQRNARGDVVTIRRYRDSLDGIANQTNICISVIETKLI